MSDNPPDLPQETGKSTASNNDSNSTTNQPSSTTQQSQSQSQLQSQAQTTAAVSSSSSSSSSLTSSSPTDIAPQQISEQQQINAKKQLEKLKQNCRVLMSKFRDEQNDIKQALQSYRNILTYYNTNQLYNDECREYIRDRFLEDSCVALMKREHHHFQQDWVMADSINESCKLLIQIAVPLIKDDSQLAMQIIYYCLNSSNPFFRHFGHDWVKLFLFCFVLFCFVIHSKTK